MSPNLRADLPASYRHSTQAAPRVLVACTLLIFLSAGVSTQNRGQKLQNPTVFTTVPTQLLLQIVRAEDERRWDNDLRGLLSARSAVVLHPRGRRSRRGRLLELPQWSDAKQAE